MSLAILSYHRTFGEAWNECNKLIYEENIDKERLSIYKEKDGQYTVNLD